MAIIEPIQTKIYVLKPAACLLLALSIPIKPEHKKAKINLTIIDQIDISPRISSNPSQFVIGSIYFKQNIIQYSLFFNTLTFIFIIF